jgi:DeoR/GlpR family transcriptional regulator of sugar metabolism
LISPVPVNVDSRRDNIVKIVAERGHVVIAELATELGVSEMTVRRDVAHLDGKGRIVAFYGGLRPVSTDSHPSAFGVRIHDEALAKTKIAARAASLVAADEVIALDAGTTVARLAENLVSHSQLRVVTASVSVISTFAEATNVDLVVLGGTLRHETQSFVGPNVTNAAQDLQVETYFMGAAGLSPRGAFDVTDIDAVVKRELIRVAARVILLADSTKFMRRAMSRISGWDGIDVLVTDDRLEDDMLRMLADSSVDVIRVPLE